MLDIPGYGEPGEFDSDPGYDETKALIAHKSPVVGGVSSYSAPEYNLKVGPWYSAVSDRGYDQLIIAPVSGELDGEPVKAHYVYNVAGMDYVDTNNDDLLATLQEIDGVGLAVQRIIDAD